MTDTFRSSRFDWPVCIQMLCQRLLVVTFTIGVLLTSASEVKFRDVTANYDVRMTSGEVLSTSSAQSNLLCVGECTKSICVHTTFRICLTNGAFTRTISHLCRTLRLIITMIRVHIALMTIHYIIWPNQAGSVSPVLPCACNLSNVIILDDKNCNISGLSQIDTKIKQSCSAQGCSWLLLMRTKTGGVSGCLGTAHPTPLIRASHIADTALMGWQKISNNRSTILSRILYPEMKFF